MLCARPNVRRSLGLPATRVRAPLHSAIPPLVIVTSETNKPLGTGFRTARAVWARRSEIRPFAARKLGHLRA